jgi:hypothetical protein
LQVNCHQLRTVSICIHDGASGKSYVVGLLKELNGLNQ